MDHGLVRVTVERDGPGRVLTVSGELDLIAAPGFAQRAAQAMAGTSGGLVLDLSGLRFIDCCGARALAAVTRGIPGDCPVLMHSARPIVRRVLDLMGLNLQRRRGEAGAVPRIWRDSEHLRAGVDETMPGTAGRLLQQSQVICARSRNLMAQSRALAGAVAATEDTVALTYVRLAEQRPPRAERLRQLSQHAHAEAGRLREQARDHGQRPAGLDPGRTAARKGLTAWVRAGPSGPVVVLSGEADMTSSGDLAELLVSRLPGSAGRLMVDVSGLSSADPAAIRALVMAAKMLRERGGTLVLLRPQRTVAKMLNLLQTDQLLAVHDGDGSDVRRPGS